MNSKKEIAGDKGIESIGFSDNASDGIAALKQQVNRQFEQNGFFRIGKHCVQVADEACELARRYGEDPSKAEVAGILHDIGAIIPNQDRVNFLGSRGIESLPEERLFPLILHQRVSAVLAQEFFQITNSDILSAIGCHTTMKTGASGLDMIVFIADKIRWDQYGDPPYINEVRSGLQVSLERGCLAYISYLMQQKEQLKVLHPWLIEAYRYLTEPKGTVACKERL